MPGPTPPPGHGLDWFTRGSAPPPDSVEEARTSIRAIAFYLHSGGALDFHDADASHLGHDRPLHLTFTIRDPAMYDYIWRQQLRAGMRTPDHVARLTPPSDAEARALRQALESAGALASQGRPVRLTLTAGRALVGDGRDLVPVTEVRLAMLAEDWIKVSQPHE